MNRYIFPQKNKSPFLIDKGKINVKKKSPKTKRIEQ